MERAVQDWWVARTRMPVRSIEGETSDAPGDSHLRVTRSHESSSQLVSLGNPFVEFGASVPFLFGASDGNPQDKGHPSRAGRELPRMPM
jgi:hypothetical protein